MASSTPTPADGTPPPADGALAPAREPHQQVLATIAEQVAAIDELVDIAEHTIRVFDDDLSQMGWNRPARADKVAAFLRRSRTAKLDVIVHDTAWLEASGARLMNLLRTFSGAITVYRTGAEAKAAMNVAMKSQGNAPSTRRNPGPRTTSHMPAHAAEIANGRPWSRRTRR